MFRLALAMGRTVKELSTSMDARELTEWMIYYSLEPWGSSVEGYRDALTCATIANAGLFSSAPKLLKKNPFHPKDFMVGASKDTHKQTWEEQKRVMDMNMTNQNAFCSKKCK